jgi:hypothetical protein
VKIVNSEYDTIVLGLRLLKQSLKTLGEYHDSNKINVDALIDKLKREHDRLALKNSEEGLSSEEQEIYPSLLYSDYGGVEDESKKVE